VPLLLRRAQRLVGMDFMDLLKDLAPGGISELLVVSGNSEDQ
jgi:type VI secretion system protein ImpA